MSDTKKSTLYRLAAIVVLKDDDLSYDDTVEIIQALGSCEELARYSEEQEAKKAAEAAE